MTLIRFSLVLASFPIVSWFVIRHSGKPTALVRPIAKSRRSLWTQALDDGCPQTGEEASTAASAADRHDVVATGQLTKWIADKTYDFDSVKTDMLEWSQSLFDNQQDAINNFVNFLQDAEKGAPENFADDILEWGMVIAGLAVQGYCKSAKDAQDQASSFLDAAVRFRVNLSEERANVKRAIDGFVTHIRTTGTSAAIIAAYSVTTRLIETLPSHRTMFNGYTSQYLSSFNFIVQRQMPPSYLTDKKLIMFLNEPGGIKVEAIWKRLLIANQGCLSPARFPVKWWVYSNQEEDVYWNCAELPFGGARWWYHCGERDGYHSCNGMLPVIPYGAKAWCRAFQHNVGDFVCKTDHFFGGEKFRC